MRALNVLVFALLACAPPPGGEGPPGGTRPIAFAPMRPVPAPLEGNLLAAADFTGDSILDLVVAAEGGGVAVLRGAGDGSFSEVSSGPTGPVTSLAAGDFNGDGKQDLAVAGIRDISIFAGQGNGTFLASEKVDQRARGLLSRDLNGDSRWDLVAAGGGSGNIPGSFVVLLVGAAQALTFPVPAPDELAEGDLNGDGKPDYIVASGAQLRRSVATFLGTGGGGFTSAASLQLGSGQMEAVAAGDLNGDGRADVITTGEDGAAVLLGQGDGRLSLSATYPTGLSGKVFAVALADFNGDGQLDAATETVPPAGPALLAVLAGAGNGTLGSLLRLQEIPTGSVSSRSLLVADVNRDGKPDLVVTPGGRQIGVFLNTTP